MVGPPTRARAASSRSGGDHRDLGRSAPRLLPEASFRPGHLFRELNVSGDTVSYAYGVGVPALLNLVRILTGNVADPHDVSWYTSLVIGILTPAVFYLLALRLTTDRKLAWTLALLLAFNPRT